MAGFLYFVAGANGSINRARAKELGIDYAFTGAISSVASAGPENKSGLIAIDQATYGDEEKHPAGYYPERQRWQKLPGVDIWVGVYTDAMPEPEDLFQPSASQGGGYSLLLGDGNNWMIRVARQPCDVDGEIAWEVSLPRKLTLGPDGSYQAGSVVSDYHDIHDVTSAFLELTFGKDKPKNADEFDVHAAAVTVLASAYRLRIAEVILLGLLSFAGEESQNILNLAIDLPSWGDLEKKRAARGDDSPAGEADGCQTTGQV